MSKTKRNQDGFGLVEVLLLIIALTLVVFVGFYIKDNNHKTATTATKPSTVAPGTAATTPSSSSTSDNSQIIAAVKSYSAAGSQTNATVTVDTIVGDNAKGQVNEAEYIAHKDSTGWQVIYEGQQQPGSALGSQYSLPSDWYSTDYQ